VGGKKAYAEVFKDAASLEAWAGGNGDPITGIAMLGHLKRLKLQSRLPLVLATDNGSAYKEKSVQAWLKANEVVHLFSRPHTPTDNGRAERGIGEGKALAGLGRRVLLESGPQGVQALQLAFNALNKNLPRTARAASRPPSSSSIYHIGTTNCIEARSTRRQAQQYRMFRTCRDGKKRKHVREAIFRTLERFELILRTRGEQKVGYVKQDRIS